MKTFSIITPVCNGQEYIANCINAIVNSKYDLSKIEHIVVDDGSKDNTKKICQKLAAKYPHIKFYSKPNGHWGSVINYVKNNKLVHNDYVFVCDADDQLLPSAFQTVNNKCNDADVFVSSFYRWNGKKFKFKILPYFYLFKRNLYKKNKWHYNSPLLVPQSGWVKKSIFYSIPNLKEGVAYQDMVLYTYFGLKARHIKFTTKATTLYWCVRPGNSMAERKSDKGVATLVDNLFFFEKQKWINPFFCYVLGLKKVRRYLNKHNYKFSFKGIKLNNTGFPAYVRPILNFLYLCFVKKYVKK